MAAFPVPKRIKLVIALSQLDPLESIRHCASMRNSPRVVREGRCRLFPENLRGYPADYFAPRPIETHRRNTHGVHPCEEYDACRRGGSFRIYEV